MDIAVDMFNKVVGSLILSLLIVVILGTTGVAGAVSLLVFASLVGMIGSNELESIALSLIMGVGAYCLIAFLPFIWVVALVTFIVFVLY